jgi:hypothetical protein
VETSFLFLFKDKKFKHHHQMRMMATADVWLHFQWIESAIVYNWLQSLGHTHNKNKRIEKIQQARWLVQMLECNNNNPERPPKRQRGQSDSTLFSILLLLRLYILLLFSKGSWWG